MIRRMLGLAECYVRANERIAQAQIDGVHIARESLALSRESLDISRRTADALERKVAATEFDLSAIAEAINGLREALDLLRGRFASDTSPVPPKESNG